MCALIVAVKSERIHQIKLLLASSSIDVNQTDASGQSALFKACLMRKKWKSIMVTKLFIKAQIDINIVDNLNRTCLSYACISGKESLVKILLETGDIAPNTKDLDGYTNLMYAVLSGNMSVVEMLLVFLTKYGLSLDDRTKEGFTAYMLAVKHGFFTIADLLREKGASTETFDFKLFRKSDEWRQISKLKVRNARLTTTISTSKPAKLNRHDSNISRTLFVLKDEMKVETVEFYHTPHIRSAGLMEAASLFRHRKKRNSESISKLPHLTTKKASMHSQNNFDNDDIDTPSDSMRYNENIAQHNNFTTKAILGTLLNESVLTKVQTEEDEKRYYNTRLFKAQNRFAFNQNNKDTFDFSQSPTLPRLDNLYADSNKLSQDRRCSSSEPAAIRDRLEMTTGRTNRRMSLVSDVEGIRLLNTT